MDRSPGSISFEDDLLEVVGLADGDGRFASLQLGPVEFVDDDIRIASVRLKSPLLEAEKSVEVLRQDAAQLADELETLHNRTPRAESIEWATIWEELTVHVTHDGRGHVTMAASLHMPRRADPARSTATVALRLDLAQLPRLTAALRRALQADKD